MKKLSVIQILPTLNTGGVERGVMDFNKFLVANGHKSFVISDGGRQVKNLIADGGEHIHLSVAKKSFLTLLQAKKLADVINEISPDIVHIRSRVPAWVLQISKLFLRKPRPLIFSTFHGLYSTPFYSRIMASFDHVIAISKTVENYVNDNYTNHLKSPPRLIYRGADDHYFSRKYQPKIEYTKDFYKKFPSLESKQLLTFPGRLSSWKGQESFIKLISDLPDSFCGLIVGPYNDAKPKYLKRLRSLIQNYGIDSRIYFYDAKDDIRDIYYLSSIVFNLSAKPEPFGRTTLEAAMMGKKICGWSRGGAGEVLDLCFPEGKVNFGDFDALVTKVKSLSASSTVPENIFLTAELMHSKTLDFYYDALDNKA